MSLRAWEWVASMSTTALNVSGTISSTLCHSLRLLVVVELLQGVNRGGGWSTNQDLFPCLCVATSF